MTRMDELAAVRSSWRHRGWLIAASVALLSYVAYVLWAKYAKVLGPPPVKLGETGEFLLFFTAVVAFAMQVIAEERRTENAIKRGEGT